MFRIKICGIKRLEDALAAAEAGADAIGLNFYSRSARYIELAMAQKIVAAMPADMTIVGVFVNATTAEIRQIAAAVPLDLIQLHGDEPPAMRGELAPWPIVRAFRCEQSQVPAILDDLRYEVSPQGVLIDAYAHDAYGGTGKTADWTLLPALRAAGIAVPLILAGGLTPENIRTALETAAPFGVDTASGVESSPGVKDREKIEQFVSIARDYFESHLSSQ